MGYACRLRPTALISVDLVSTSNLKAMPVIMGKERQVVQREINTATKFYFTPTVTSPYIYSLYFLIRNGSKSSGTNVSKRFICRSEVHFWPAHDTATDTEWQLPEVVLTQFVSPDDEHDVLETCRELKIKINT
jgi:hypothetical protein